MLRIWRKKLKIFNDEILKNLNQEDNNDYLDLNKNKNPLISSTNNLNNDFNIKNKDKEIYDPIISKIKIKQIKDKETGTFEINNSFNINSLMIIWILIILNLIFILWKKMM